MMSNDLENKISMKFIQILNRHLPVKIVSDLEYDKLKLPIYLEMSSSMERATIKEKNFQRPRNSFLRCESNA